MPQMQICFISTFIPRKCGLATFTDDLAQALAGLGRGPEPWVAAVDNSDNNDQPLQYDRRVRLKIKQEDESSYAAAAGWLNRAPVDVVMIEHEYGIFGGPYGSYVLTLLKNLKKPALVTLHTILPEPLPEQAAIMHGLTSYGAGLVSLAEKGRDILIERYGLPGEKISVIRHGVPSAPRESAAALKDRYGLTGRQVISTFGLLHPGKGIEYALGTLPKVVAEHPEVVYLILGQTHPEVQKKYGDAYLKALQAQAERLGLKDNVMFVNRYLDQDELMEYLALTDVYVTPYLNPEQISSGPLAYAVALGKAVVSTPYLCAEELLDDGRGLLVPFRSKEPLSQALRKLLGDAALKAEMERKTAAFGRSLSWSAVAGEYYELMKKTAAEHEAGAREVKAPGLGALAPQLSGG